MRPGNEACEQRIPLDAKVAENRTRAAPKVPTGVRLTDYAIDEAPSRRSEERPFPTGEGDLVNSETFAVLFVVGAAALSMWFVMRWPALAPSNFKMALVHLGVSLVAMYVAVPVLTSAAGVIPQPYQAHVTIFGVLLPAFVYRMVSMIWVLRLAQGSLGSALH